MIQTTQRTIERLRGALCDYIEASYHISGKSLIVRRKRLLDQPGVVHQVPYLESTPRYREGTKFADMTGLPVAALEAFEALSERQGKLPKLIFDPPYQHQSEAVATSLIEGRNLIIMTGTGSGKTEAFLLPILGKLAQEAKEHPVSFGNQPAMRALILYPMNALVNDQLGRLRALFGDERIVSLFTEWAGRPPRFARYTSRTPYAGMRTSKKDSRNFRLFAEFYCDTERRARDSDSSGHAEALELLEALKACGKWPAKPELAAWLGKKGSRWQEKATGSFVRAATLPGDSELLTRHEVQAAPPDLVVTNYSMLEYMLMRPIERTIFDATRAYLGDNPSEKFLVVLDEAHLYRGAAGAEVGLLLRRLRDRLGISAARFQVIGATASFNDHARAPHFGAQLSGLPAESFVPISGALDLERASAVGTRDDADALASIDLPGFYRSTTEAERLVVLGPFLEHRRVVERDSSEIALYHALDQFGPMGLLINNTMNQAIRVAELGYQVFPTAPRGVADAAVNVLMALGSMARLVSGARSLFPSRIHSFFRGLPGLWVCMDPGCTDCHDEEDDGICGRMYSQPRDTCECGARVLELYTCRNCGTAYARAYTDDVDNPTALWPEAGEVMRLENGPSSPLFPLDLLLESPGSGDVAEPAEYDLETGRLNSMSTGPRTRQVYLRGDRIVEPLNDGEGSRVSFDSRGEFKPCAVCGESARFGRSYVQNHQTKGDEPFQALVGRQLQIQPPSPAPPTAFAPLQGRKVLAFSDSRQVAARLAPNLQMFSVRDALRPLMVWGYQRLQGVPTLLPHLNLEDLYLAILLASRKFRVRLRPEMGPGESFAAEKIVDDAMRGGAADEDAGLLMLCMEIRNERPPEALLDNIVTTVGNRFLGLEALALASIAERDKHTPAIERLPTLAGVAETPEAKVALVRAWLRCWHNYGFWLSAMPPVWWKRPRAEGTSVRGHKGNFKAVNTILRDPAAQRFFRESWLPSLLDLFTEKFDHGYTRLRGSELTLRCAGAWSRCATCKSVHRPVPGIEHCLDCASGEVAAMEPDSDRVFLARKGFYRKPVVEALGTPPRPPMALVAAEHTAQLNAPQNEDVFSKAEENELLFQDIELGAQSRHSTAIDVLSSTTTMEVGIDIGALSGVALRNMPPGRANYQQRSGRAGRRGNAVATVVAFGRADSHDEYYFTAPEEMICGDVIDPVLTLDNAEIVRRHIRAFILQNYHQDRLPQIDPDQPHDLFAVLGTVTEFRTEGSVLNRGDLATWLAENERQLKERVALWIPGELSSENRRMLLSEMLDDCLEAVDEAIGGMSEEADGEKDSGSGSEEVPEEGDERSQSASRPDKLLDRLLYCGKLPRYAFPTDVATFHVFDRDRSSYFRPVMRFAPQQSLPVALTQYAPSKQIWISGKCYTSGAIYSVDRNERYGAWEAKRVYMECQECGFAKTYPIGAASRNESRDCEACGGHETFGPGRYWVRPPGFAHPIDAEEVTSPDDVPETSYATRAKLSVGTPGQEAGWLAVTERVQVLPSRQHLLVTNTGPKREGYTYCTRCGRIEASRAPSPVLSKPHRKPFPETDRSRMCEGISPTRHIVLGTDFITDIALFALRVGKPMRLTPGHTPTIIALRTVSEALAIAACRLLEIEAGEIVAEFRPALTPGGKSGREAEMFLYDTLPGGAGFSSRLAGCGFDVLELALELMESCPENCDASCYRCLRSFKNKFEHGLLDRHVGRELLKYLLRGTPPEFSRTRVRRSTTLLYQDLVRQSREGVKFSSNVAVTVGGKEVVAPIRAETRDGRQHIVALSGPLTPDQPADPELAKLSARGNVTVVVENELLVRGNLPAASRRVFQKVGC